LKKKFRNKEKKEKEDRVIIAVLLYQLIIEQYTGSSLLLNPFSFQISFFKQ